MVESENSRIVVIFGPPGTGKTTDLGNRISRACETYPPDSIYVCSLTKTAARTIAGRDVGALPEENIRTLHSLCHRHLQLDSKRMAFNGEFLEEWNDQNPEFAIAGSNVNTDDPFGEESSGTGREIGDDLLGEYGRLQHMGIERDEWVERARDSFWIADPTSFAYYATVLPEFVTRWEAFKEARGLHDFDDMIRRALAAPPLSGSILVVDEAQDLSALEMQVIHHWVPGFQTVVMAGDDDQVLYAFRGASERTLIELKTDRVITLAKSYRLRADVLAHAKGISARLSRRALKEFGPHADGGSVEFDTAINHQRPYFAVKRAAELAAAGSESMILAPCGYMLDRTIRTLRELGIPFHNPYRPTNGRWNPLKANARRLAEFLRPSRQFYGDRARPWSLAEVSHWIEPLSCKAAGISGEQKERIKKAARKLRDTKNRIVDQPLTTDAMRELGLATIEPSLDCFRRSVLPSQLKSFDYALTIADKNPTLLSGLEKPKVIVGTVHSCKGGEADNTFLFCETSPRGRRELSMRGPDVTLRMLYVGATRARERMVFCGAANPECDLYEYVS